MAYDESGNPDDTYNQALLQQMQPMQSRWNPQQLAAAKQVQDYYALKNPGQTMTADEALNTHLTGGRYLKPENIQAAYRGIDASLPKATSAPAVDQPVDSPAFTPGAFQSQSLGSWNPDKLSANDPDIKYQVGRNVGGIDPNASDAIAQLVKLMSGKGVGAGPSWDTATIPGGEIVDLIAGEPGARKWWWGQDSEQGLPPNMGTSQPSEGNRGTDQPLVTKPGNEGVPGSGLANTVGSSDFYNMIMREVQNLASGQPGTLDQQALLAMLARA